MRVRNLPEELLLRVVEVVVVGGGGGGPPAHSLAPFPDWHSMGMGVVSCHCCGEDEGEENKQ